jgi:metallo-beta-lactamase family protein
MTKPTVQFLGAAETVTGSKHLISANGSKVLLDCGLFQGLKQLRLRNREAPDFVPADIDAIVISHAHIDHSGYLPLLVRLGYGGPIYCTPATADLLAILLRDSAYLQEEHAAHANRWGYSKHTPAVPLYTMEDAENTLPLIQPQMYREPFAAANGVEVVLRCAGHILGSATVELRLGGGNGTKDTTVVFTGDLGRWDRPILKDPTPVTDADYVLIESTYGNRTHEEDPDSDLARLVTETAAEGGAIVIPAFAVGRTQEVLWRLRQLEEAGQIPVLPTYIDSPMAINVTDLYRRHPEEHDLEMATLLDEGSTPLKPELFATARTVQESKKVNALEGPVVIISASGMAGGGRILHHLKRRLPDHRNTVILTGYQAVGTRGRSLQDGAKEVKIHGQQVDVRARIETVHGLSAHADKDEAIRWLSGFEREPKQTFAVHGEPTATEAMVQNISGRLGWNATVAKDGQVAELG